MHKVKTRNRLDLIDCWGVQPAVALHLYKGRGLDPLQTDFRVNPVVLGNKSREKLGTLTDSAHARTVREALFGFQHTAYRTSSEKSKENPKTHGYCCTCDT
jgi:hypothetical protein